MNSVFLDHFFWFIFFLAPSARFVQEIQQVRLKMILMSKKTIVEELSDNHVPGRQKVKVEYRIYG